MYNCNLLVSGINTGGGCAGNIMFLHTNLSPKWSLEIPADFSHYNRRWQVGLILWTNMRCQCFTAG